MNKRLTARDERSERTTCDWQVRYSSRHDARTFLHPNSGLSFQFLPLETSLLSFKPGCLAGQHSLSLSFLILLLLPNDIPMLMTCGKSPAQAFVNLPVNITPAMWVIYESRFILTETLHVYDGDVSRQGVGVFNVPEGVRSVFIQLERHLV